MTAAANDDDTSRLAIGPDDLAAYAQGRLSGARRRRVEGYLACNPDLAAGMMTRLHMSAAAPRRRVGSLAMTAMAAVIVGLGAGAGWAAARQVDLDGWRELDGGSPPPYVEEAAEVRDALAVRGRMASQAETAHLDAAEIRQSLRLALPPLPAGYTVRDVQVVPTDLGPGVALALDSPAHGRLQLFAVRTAGARPDQRPDLAALAGEQVAFWRRDGVGYVLAGPRSAAELRSGAAALGGTAGL